MQLMIIGRALKLRSFRENPGHELGLDYHVNSKAQMTMSLFFLWVQRLENYIQKTTGRRILRLVDNCSANGTKETLPTLGSVRVYFLPSNTTSEIQPLDAGIFTLVMAKYPHRVLLGVSKT